MELIKGTTIVYSGRDLSDDEVKSYQSKNNEKLIVVRSTSETINRRTAAYKAESDPLYMEWQYDKTPESEKSWRDQVAEIKQRYPFPESI